MMHHNTKFGNKIFGGVEGIIWTNTDILTLRCDLDKNAVIHFFPQDTLVYDDVSSDQVCLPRNQQFRKYNRKSHTLIIWALTVTLTLKIANLFSFLHDTLAHCCITIPNLVTKCSVIQKISSRKTFTDILNLCCDLDLKCSNPIFPQDTPAYDTLLSSQVWLQTDQQFRRYNRNSHILII